ncbi:hypothetical protein GCM10015535_64690 [Streptomyces gelaticus]|uniref:Uncharacterized protein n=1 Tax=Streptomyces gelaticus TaxID=285446 RepID=A0ABQ2WBS4_9ACTN|nr:hypothetical protein GCM10015535_64690 [Streptomyces gelaticus]
MLTINVAVLLAINVILRLRRRTEARSRPDERFTAIAVLCYKFWPPSRSLPVPRSRCC